MGYMGFLRYIVDYSYYSQSIETSAEYKTRYNDNDDDDIRFIMH